MGYCSEVIIATTKKDYLTIQRDQNKIRDNHFLELADIEEYKVNDKECVLIQLYCVKYYKEFEKIQTLEKSMSKLKDGYVFCRLGEERGDIEFRKKTKLPELMEKFDFIREINQNLNEELREEEEEIE